MQIIEYESKYLEGVRDLLVELEEFILNIDEDELDQLHPEYREKMALVDLEDVEKYKGKCFLALDNGKVVGLIMGTIPPYDENDYLDYKCPKRGVITELIVTQKVRSNGIGKVLMKQMEDYFKENGCEWVLVDVFAYNKKAIDFYSKRGYHHRMFTDVKKI